MTVQQVIDHLRSDARENENIYYIYVVGPRRVLTGVVSLRDMIMSPPETLISAIVERDVFTVGVDDDQEQVADLVSKYDLLAMPVVDEAGRILGIVTVDDALDVMDEEAAEDLALATGAGSAARANIGGWLAGSTDWLVAWAIAGALTAGMLSLFWRYSGGFVVAVIFVPLIMRLSDQVTSHSFARLIDPSEGGLARTFLGQLLVDLAAGVALGTISGLVALAVLQVMREPLAGAAMLAAAMAVTIIVLTLVGSILPLVLRRKDGTWRGSSAFVTALMGSGGVVLFMVLAVALRATGK